MTRRIQLMIDKSGIAQGATFKVYRSATSDVSTASPLVMQIKEAIAPVTVLKVIETLSQDFETVNKFHARRPFMATPAPVVYIDGVQVGSNNLEIYGDKAEVYIHNQNITGMYTKTVTMEYSYEGIVVLDHAVAQTGVTYTGPVPTSAPANFQCSTTLVNNEPMYQGATWSIPTKIFYYLITATDQVGHVSPASEPHGITFFTGPLTNITYKLEYASKAYPDNWITDQVVSGTSCTFNQVLDTHDYLWRISATFGDGSISEYAIFGGE